MAERGRGGAGADAGRGVGLAGVAPGRFLLIAGEDGQAWWEAARQLAAEANVPLDALRIGHLDGDLYDPRCTWLRHRQIAGGGAVLVRPDWFIAWRHPAGTGDPRAALAAALSQILARPGRRAGRIGSLIPPLRPCRARTGRGL
jgi:2,4-dichlorophenol 6-monooxygenase